jgi:lipopolysaccharide export system protein LptA
MLYLQEEGLLRAEDNVVFTRGGDRLSSRRLSVDLETTGDGVGNVRSIQSRWQVAGRIALDSSADREGVLEFTAETMGITFDATGKRVESVVLEGGIEGDVEGGSEEATLLLADGTGRRQTLRSQEVQIGFAGGAVSRLDTYLPAILEESLAVAGAAPLRRLCGDTLSVKLGPDGGLRNLVLDGAVDYHDTRLSASGDRLAGDPEDKLRLSGSPARVFAGTNDVEAARIVYSRGDGSLLATGGVRASGLDRSGVELAAGDNRAPVLVTADRATWTEEPSEVAFLGKVRAWQGESFLLADQLRSLDQGAELIGQGAVKTVWKPRPDDPEGRPPIDVDAQEFAYTRDEQRLDYSGNVRAHEAGRTLRCDDLEILLDAERRVDSLLCEGDAVVEDPANGRKVRGSEALYTPGDRLVVISGEPVVLEQRDGTEMEGRRLRYDLDTGQVRILSEPRTLDSEEAPADAPEPADG